MDAAFANDAEVEEFAQELYRAFTAVLQISAAGSLFAGKDSDGMRRSAIFAELLARMHHYKFQKIRTVVSPEFIQQLDRDMEVVWPRLQAMLDRDVESSVQLYRDLNEEGVH